METKSLNYFTLFVGSYLSLSFFYYLMSGLRAAIFYFKYKSQFSKYYCLLSFSIAGYALFGFTALSFILPSPLRENALNIASIFGMSSLIFYVFILRKVLRLWQKSSINWILILSILAFSFSVLVTIYQLFFINTYPYYAHSSAFLSEVLGSVDATKLGKASLAFDLIVSLGSYLLLFYFLLKSKLRDSYIFWGLILSILIIIFEVPLNSFRYMIPFLPFAFLPESIRFSNMIDYSKHKKLEFKHFYLEQLSLKSKFKLIQRSLIHDIKPSLSSIKRISSRYPQKDRDLVLRSLSSIEKKISDSAKYGDEIEEVTQFNFSTLLKEIATPYHERFLEERVSLELDVSTDLIFHGDPAHFYILFSNLFTNSLNALNAKKDGPKEISISISKQKDRLDIDFSDTGIGFDKKYHFPEDTALALLELSRPGKGLMFINKIVQEYYGSLNIYCTENRTTFKIQFSSGDQNNGP
jgi:signal transduction histidine kinase